MALLVAISLLQCVESGSQKKGHLSNPPTKLIKEHGGNKGMMQHGGEVHTSKRSKLKSKIIQIMHENDEYQKGKKIIQQEKIYSKLCRPSYHKFNIKHHISSLPKDSPLKYIIENNIKITPQVLAIKQCGTCNFQCTDNNGRRTGEECTSTKQKEKTFIFYHYQDGNEECFEGQRKYLEIKIMEDKKCK
ncbi:unnamed protein product, partial [Meganyctiphanes norvegica]